MRKCLFWTSVLAGTCAMLIAARVAAAEDKVLFDFEDQASVSAWSNIDVYALRQAEAKAAYDAALKAARERRCAAVRGSLGTTYRCQHSRP